MLSHVPGVQGQHVAQALDIHPWMLSRWRKEQREGTLRGKVRKLDLDARQVAELKRLRELERQYALLREEHELLKKYIRYCSRLRSRSSRSSSRSAPSTA
jgi:transposase